MTVKAIVYTSNTGYTAEYAKLLHDATGLPVYSLEDAKRKLAHGTEIVYLGWLMAGMIQGYKEAVQLYNIKTVCGVCLATSGSQTESVRKTNAISKDTPLFTIQGGFDMKKLKGMHKLAMKVVSKVMKNKINSKNELTQDDKNILSMLEHGGSQVSMENLKEVIALIKQ